MNRFWTLSGKPVGAWPEAETFVLQEDPIPSPGPGQALTRTLYISLDPYQWGFKRRGVDRAEITALRAAYQALAQGDGTFLDRARKLAEETDSTHVREITDFILSNSDRSFLTPK
jgi:hypothetical protein